MSRYVIVAEYVDVFNQRTELYSHEIPEGVTKCLADFLCDDVVFAYFDGYVNGVCSDGKLKPHPSKRKSAHTRYILRVEDMGLIAYSLHKYEVAETKIW